MSTHEETIRALEARRYAAMRQGDAAALGALLSDRLVYAHSNATTDSKASYLGTLEGGSLRYLDIRFETEQVLEAGPDCAVALGRMSADIIRYGGPRSIAAMTCAVWAREGEAWRLLAYQPTALPQPEAKP
ncbi:nuclear transport factor 2 family protein [Roseomonas sp. OT10]|uniref:nuclear transport factor 2 family protein n=1 Tax=Roseomonas cutis TaxID=2897332 RepID=UPI001E3EA898|nr:nuclear transport factor 2 family protein [Roseomonas sp. OT10]UFN47155.1 nuclear transport factor 2 family protein [Roseomonas sp. OT10]